MKKNIYIIGGLTVCVLIFLIYFLFVGKNEKYHFITTFNLGDSLYVEKYELYTLGNTPSGEYAEYLTDSINFRKYIGMYNDYSLFKYQKNGGVLIIKTINRQDSLKIYETKSYQISVLKKTHSFE